MVDSGDIYAWEDDPGAPPPAHDPVRRPQPDLPGATLPVAIEQARPSVPVDTPGSPEFLWWNAADALSRARDLWTQLVPAGTTWHATVGAELNVSLDSPQAWLNAEYHRAGLAFYHDQRGGITCYTAESPDVVAHEFGHAVLDALRPQLWDATGTEPAAFHESFGDISALLTALQLPSLREALLEETAGKVWRSSRVSRVAEQLGWAIRQGSPDRAEPQALRDAANSWFYRDPALLPPDGPASQMSSEPHFFARIFTGAILKALAGMFEQADTADADSLLQASLDLGHLVVDAVLTAPIVPGYYSQLAAHMIAADANRFQGRYTAVLRFAFVRHGVLALSAAQGMTMAVERRSGMSIAGPQADLPQIALAGASYGLPGDLFVRGSGDRARRFAVAGSAPDAGPVATPSSDRAAELFVEDLVRLGRVDVEVAPGAFIPAPVAYKTHALAEADGGFELQRKVFDCGIHPPGVG